MAGAVSAGVCGIVGVGINAASNSRILDIASSSPVAVYPAIGLYPDEVEPGELQRVLEQIETHREKLVALGEIGLDYWIKPLRKKQPGREEKKQLQIEAFRLQLRTARRLDLPVIVHSRGAWRDAFACVREEKIPRAIFHWYTGPREVLKEIIEAGYLISATPATGYSPPLREALRTAPLESVVLETDCPVPVREDRDFIPTVPGDVRRSLTALGALRGIDPAELADITTANARRFLGLKVG